MKCPICNMEMKEKKDDYWVGDGLPQEEKQMMDRGLARKFECHNCVKTKQLVEVGYCYLLVNGKWYCYNGDVWVLTKKGDYKEKVIFT